MSVDGTDCWMKEPWPYNKTTNAQWFSHKNKKASLRYEVAFSISKGDIVWINGPYEAGLWTDNKIFNDGLKFYLDINERVEADQGYQGSDPHYTKTPYG